MPSYRFPGYILARSLFLCAKRCVNDDLARFTRCWMYGEACNGDDASLLPSVVVIRPIFTKERVVMLTLCLPLSDVMILQDIDRSLQWFLDI